MKGGGIIIVKILMILESFCAIAVELLSSHVFIWGLKLNDLQCSVSRHNFMHPVTSVALSADTT